MIGWLLEVITYGAIGALIGASLATHYNSESAAQCVTQHERQLSPHETQPGPIPAMTQGGLSVERWVL